MQRLTLVLMLLFFVYSHETASMEYCAEDTFSPQCPEGEIIMLTEARYGRMKIGKCVPLSFGHIGCYADVLGMVDNACSGRQSCEFAVFNTLNEKDESSTCPKGLQRYLYATFTCIKVVSTSDTQCSDRGTLESSGHISSYDIRKKCGNRNTSWMIKSSPGQQVNISLVDFGYGTEAKQAWFGHITEEGHKSNTTICRQHGQKEQQVYTSNGRDVVIELSRRPPLSGAAEFLLYYKVYGCADVNVPEGAWYKRKGGVATVGCDSTDLSWTVHCEGTEWKGTIGSCPIVDSSPVREAQSTSNWINIGLEGDFSMLILVCIGVGFVILIAICVALIIIKLRRRDPPPSTRLLDADYRKSVLEPFPPMSAHESGHYRSLVKSRDQPGYPDPHCSSSVTASHFQLPDDNGYPLPQATDGTIRQQQPHFSTLQHTVQRSTASREGGAPDYFVLDKQFC